MSSLSVEELILSEIKDTKREVRGVRDDLGEFKESVLSGGCPRGKSNTHRINEVNEKLDKHLDDHGEIKLGLLAKLVKLFTVG